MRLLLDTSVFSWMVLDDIRITPSARQAIGAPGSEVFVSIASAWAMAIKVGLGKWPAAAELVQEFDQHLRLAGVALLGVTLDHVRTAGLMQHKHRDPFDRLLAAQAGIEGLTLVTSDAKLAGLGAPILW